MVARLLFLIFPLINKIFAKILKKILTNHHAITKYGNELLFSTDKQHFSKNSLNFL